MKIKNKVVVITGTSNGVGRACACKFLSKHAKVYGVDIDDNGKKMEKNFRHFKFIHADISKAKDIENAKRIISKKEEKVDILVNNAAKQSTDSFSNTKIKDFKDVVETNLIGTFICSKIISDLMGENGRIINMLSVHSQIVRKDRYAYDASKAGEEMLTKEMALYFIKKNINVLGISYGACNTKLNEKWISKNEEKENVLEKIPMRWIAEPNEIAEFVINIIEKFSDYTTGNIFTIDGGRSLLR